jgi:hypothetical protein
LLGENEIEFGIEGTRPNVLVDGCKVSESIWTGLERHSKLQYTYFPDWFFVILHILLALNETIKTSLNV